MTTARPKTTSMALQARVKNAKLMMLDAVGREDGIQFSFADGLTGTVPWSYLGLRPELIAGLRLDSPYVLNARRKDGKVEEIPWSLVRRALDGEFRAQDELADQAGRETLGTRVRTRRQKAHLSQAALADMAFIPRSMVSRIERGDAGFRVDLLDAIALALGCELTDLLLPEEDQEGPRPS